MTEEKIISRTDLMSIEFLKQENEKLTNYIKTLIYKENTMLFDLLDFENNKIFQDPLLFAYFNSEEKLNTLDQLLYGHIYDQQKPGTISVCTDEKGTVYLPNYGWLFMGLENKTITLQKKKDGDELVFNDKKIAHSCINNYFIGNSNFELVPFFHPLFKQHYYSDKGNLVSVEIEAVTKEKMEYLEEAVEVLRQIVPDYYEKLSSVISKMVIFRDSSLERNSFASLSVHGCIFFNAYQKDYNEIFFIEDIAHQGAHVIFNALSTCNKSLYFKVDPETYLTDKGVLGWVMHRLEKRTLFVLMHALHTYSAIITCLDAYLDSELGDKVKRHEAVGRLGFAIRKLQLDLKIIDRNDKDKSNRYLTSNGMTLLEEYKNTYRSVVHKRKHELKSLKFINQPYNFTYSKFVELNPLRS